MPQRIIPYLKIGVTIITTSATIFAALWFFAEPHINAHIEKQFKAYLATETYKIQERAVAKEVSQEVFIEFLTSKNFDQALDNYLNKANSNNVSLRQLLAIKMGVPKESVADRIAELHNEDKKRLHKVLRILNQMYPELNVWELD